MSFSRARSSESRKVHPCAGQRGTGRQSGGDLSGHSHQSGPPPYRAAIESPRPSRVNLSDVRGPFSSFLTYYQANRYQCRASCFRPPPYPLVSVAVHIFPTACAVVDVVKLRYWNGRPHATTSMYQSGECYHNPSNRNGSAHHEGYDHCADCPSQPDPWVAGRVWPGCSSRYRKHCQAGTGTDRGCADPLPGTFCLLI